MSDLIKREEVLKVIHDYFKEFLDYIEEQENEEEKYSRDIFMVLAENKKLCTKIKEIPVAYDVDKVAKELEDYQMWKGFMIYDLTHREREIIRKAIEIVKGGGVNERD